MRLCLYLRQPLFVLPAPHDHAPARAMVIEGTVAEASALPGGTGGGVLLTVTDWYDERGNRLSGPTRAPTLLIPGSKIDHARVVEG